MSASPETPTLKPSSIRNQSMDVCKLIASFFVVFDHAVFPGKLGEILIYLCSFAVPMFFMVSGYNNYGATSEQIHRRTRGIFKLLVIGTLYQLLGNCLAVELRHGSSIAYLRSMVPTPTEVVNCIVLHIHPIAGHLWFLNGLIAVYLIFGIFTRFQNSDTPNYRPFYFVSAVFFILLLSFGTFLPASGVEGGLPLRNGWFLGIPMFGAGLFFREYQERILSAFPLKKSILWCIVVGGACFGVLQGLTVGAGQLPFGMYFTVFALMLLMVSHPILAPKPGLLSGFLRHCGSLSTWIYLFHLYFVTKYERFFQSALVRLTGETEPYVYPLFILAVSILNAIVWETGSTLLKRRKKTAKK